MCYETPVQSYYEPAVNGKITAKNTGDSQQFHSVITTSLRPIRTTSFTALSQLNS